MAVGWYMGLFYSDDGMIESTDPECLQGAINVLIILFIMVGLMDNAEKYDTMTCHQGGFSQGLQSWPSVVVLEERGPLTRSVYGGASHYQTGGWR